MSKEKTNTMTLSEMVAEYNRLTDKAVISFTDRATAIRRLKAARVLAASDKKLSKKKDGASISKKKVVSKGKRKSTKDSGRAFRPFIKVTVSGKKYDTVSSAFRALGISTERARSFRTILKRDNKATIDGHLFKLVS